MLLIHTENTRETSPLQNEAPEFGDSFTKEAGCHVLAANQSPNGGYRRTPEEYWRLRTSYYMSICRMRHYVLGKRGRVPDPGRKFTAHMGGQSAS